VSPKQKADVVRLAAEFEDNPVTLSIGDGANDVSMIVAADIGVGILGAEGAQAAHIADFAISGFRCLRRLLFVHGRESYRRNAMLATYSFYKTQLVVLAPLYYTCWRSGFSGPQIFDPVLLSVYNVLLTQFPIMFFALFDRREDHNVLELRYAGYGRRLFRRWFVFLWFVIACTQSVFLSFVADTGVFTDDPNLNGFWTVGTMLFFWVVLNVNLMLVGRINSWYWFSPFPYIAGLSLFLVVVFIGKKGLYGVGTYLFHICRERIGLATLLAVSGHLVIAEAFIRLLKLPVC